MLRLRVDWLKHSKLVASLLVVVVPPHSRNFLTNTLLLQFSKLAVPEKWNVTKCHKLIESCTSDIENYQLGQAGSKVYEFLRDDLADWYLEMSKTRFYPGLGGA